MSLLNPNQVTADFDHSPGSADLPAEPALRLRNFIWFFCAGLPGIAAVSILVIPSLLGNRPGPMPIWVMSVAAGLQSAVTLALAVWVGLVLKQRLGLRSPVFQALVASRPWLGELRSQIPPGFLGGLIGAAVLVLVAKFTPPSLLAIQGKMEPFHIVARVLYGGVTEELMLRWGFMSCVLWLLWRFMQRSDGPPNTMYTLLAIAVSALMFGLGHLPAALALVGTLTTDVVAYVIVGNAAFGVIAGYLFWTYGLESAIIAHAITHLALAAFGY